MAVGRKMLVIIGATASGKSEVALESARKTGAEILSVDSMQVYRGMDIGTAKPTMAERALVKHHLIDLATPDQPFTVARFVEMAEEVIRSVPGPLVVTGGTPLYYKGLFAGLFEGPEADEALRRKLKAMGNERLFARLAEVDPAAAGRIHVNDTKRLVRALEVYELTGKPISAWQTEWEAKRVRHEAVWVGLAWEREPLNRRINARVKAMIAAGWVEETRGLLQRYGELSATAREATGYRHLIEHLRGKMTLEDAVEQIKIETRQLARKQMKWFKRFEDVHWIAGDWPLEKRVEAAMAWWEGA